MRLLRSLLVGRGRERRNVGRRKAGHGVGEADRGARGEPVGGMGVGAQWHVLGVRCALGSQRYRVRVLKHVQFSLS